MIFAYTHDKVLSGKKTQTRRLVKPGEDGAQLRDGSYWAVWDRNGRWKWEVGRTYAVQPGRGKHAVGRILVTRMRKEWLQDITREDEIAEGFPLPLDFKIAWDRINNRPGARWEDNPRVWVLEFELVTEPEPA